MLIQAAVGKTVYASFELLANSGEPDGLLQLFEYIAEVC